MSIQELKRISGEALVNSELRARLLSADSRKEALINFKLTDDERGIAMGASGDSLADFARDVDRYITSLPRNENL